jgi:hypothetical protein
VREYAQRVLALEEERDRFAVEVERVTAAARGPRPTPSGSDPADVLMAREAELFEMRLQQDQAMAQVLFTKLTILVEVDSSRSRLVHP